MHTVYSSHSVWNWKIWLFSCGLFKQLNYELSMNYQITLCSYYVIPTVVSSAVPTITYNRPQCQASFLRLFEVV